MENTGKPPVKGRIHIGHARPGGCGFSATKTKGSKGVTKSVSKTTEQVCACKLPIQRPKPLSRVPRVSWGLVAILSFFFCLPGVKDSPCEA